MIGKKFLVDGKRTACLKQIICLLGVIWKVSNRKTLSGGTVCFLEKCLLSIFKFDALNNLSFFFPTSWLILNQLSWNVLLFSCYPIGQLCLSDPSYNSSTVILGSLSNNDSNGNEDGKRAIKKNFRLTKQQLCMCITLFALSLQSPYDYNVKVSRDVNSRQWTLIQSFRIQLHTNFLTFDKLNQLE